MEKIMFYKDTKFKEIPELGIKVPEDWEVIRLGDIAIVKRGASPRPKGDPRYFGGDIPWIKISDISKYKVGVFLIKTEEGVTEEGKKKSVYIPDGTLIISNSGTIGVPAIVETGRGGCIHDGIIALLNLRAEKLFMYYYLEYIQPILHSKAQKGTQGNLNTNIWKSVKIPLLPLEEQKAIAEILNTIDKAIELLKKKKELLEKVKKWFMQKLLTGEIRVKIVKNDLR